MQDKQDRNSNCRVNSESFMQFWHSVTEILYITLASNLLIHFNVLKHALKLYDACLKSMAYMHSFYASKLGYTLFLLLMFIEMHSALTVLPFSYMQFAFPTPLERSQISGFILVLAINLY